MFTLARDTRQSLDEVLALPYAQLVAWKAYYAVERAVRDLHKGR